MFSLALVAALVVQPGPTPPERLELRKQLEHIRNTYIANRGAFPFGTFRFDYMVGAAENEKDARAGRMRHESTARGLYVFNGSNARYEVVFSEEDLRRATRKIGEGKHSSSLHCFRSLTDGQVTLLDTITAKEQSDQLRHSPRILPEVYFHEYFAFPLGLGDPHFTHFNLARDIDRYLEGKIELKSYEPRGSFEGESVAVVVFKLVAGIRTYWIDLGHGAVPVQAHDEVTETGRILGEYLEQVDFEPGLGWLPHVMTSCTDQGRRVVRIVVREVVVDRPPTPTDYRLEFPTEVAIFDQARGRSYPQQKVWSLLALPRPSAVRRESSVGAGYQASEPVMPGERSSVWFRWPLAVLMLLGGGLLVWLALRSRLRG